MAGKLTEPIELWTAKRRVALGLGGRCPVLLTVYERLSPLAGLPEQSGWPVNPEDLRVVGESFPNPQT